MTLVRIVVVGLVVALVGCKSSHVVAPASSEQRLESQGAPSWVVTPPHDSQYLYGVGSAEIYGDKVRALQQAEDVARGDLIKQLKVNVSQSLTSTTNVNNSVVSKTAEVIVKSRVPETEMAGIERLDSFEDKVARSVYALVRLDRVKAISSLRQDLQTMELDLSRFERRTSSNDLMEDIKFFLPALPKIRAYQLNADKLKLLAANDKSSGTLNYDPSGLQQRIYEMLGRIRVRLYPENELARSMAIELAEQLTAQGVKVVSHGDFELLVSFNLSKIDKQNQGTQFVLLQGNMKVKDDQGQILKAYGVDAKGGAYDQDLARQRAMKKISDKMGSDLVKGLFEYL
ncbi:LPP20 family lipoprotein [Litoribrevibacter euphylliae]|uniref:LPP20 family lipoprotein n=1 Tax=Litoribrevibacter euphylliae TaxID=1834034 RepID=A0ABV7HDM1_9GAMM